MTRSWLRQWLAAHTALRLVVATVLLGLAVVIEFRTPGTGSVNPYFILLGVTFGGCFFGHGAYVASGSARFIMTGFSVQ